MAGEHVTVELVERRAGHRANKPAHIRRGILHMRAGTVRESRPTARTREACHIGAGSNHDEITWSSRLAQGCHAVEIEHGVPVSSQPFHIPSPSHSQAERVALCQCKPDLALELHMLAGPLLLRCAYSWLLKALVTPVGSELA